MAKPDRDAEFTEYVTARSPWLRRVAYLLCGDWHRADDLVQTTITKLYSHWGRASRAENLDGYARRTLINTYLAEQRSGWARWTILSRRGSGEPGGDLGEFAAATADDAGIGIGTRSGSTGSTVDVDLSLDLKAALAKLPPRQRATVVLRFYCDLSVEQTAQVMGCSTGNVKSQSSRGLAALRTILDPNLVPALEGTR